MIDIKRFDNTYINIVNSITFHAQLDQYIVLLIISPI